MPGKPTVFVGSSKEGLKLAKAIHSNLHRIAEVTDWGQRVFSTNRSNLDNIMRALDRFDFAVFVWSADDILRMRNESYLAVRDNLIFEFGMFLGRLGRDNVFAVIPQDEPGLHILSDLQGVRLLEYEKRSDGNLEASVSIACEEIRPFLESFAIEARSPRLTPQQLLAKLDEGLDRIMSRSLSTAYVGTFPTFIEKHIIPCVESAQNAVRIACDFPSYGSFSVFPMFDCYKTLLESKYRNDVPINFLVLNKTGREDRTLRQFGTNEKEWEKLRTNAAFSKLFDDFKTRTGARVLDLRQFRTELERLEASYIADFNEKMPGALKEVGISMPLYLWIADDKRAVFVIPTSGPYSEEHGFETRDQDLVKGLLYIWERYGKGADELKGEEEASAA